MKISMNLEECCFNICLNIINKRITYYLRFLEYFSSSNKNSFQNIVNHWIVKHGCMVNTQYKRQIKGRVLNKEKC
jgi:hypothetical protein